MQNNNFLLLKKFKNTESAQLCPVGRNGLKIVNYVEVQKYPFCINGLNNLNCELLALPRFSPVPWSNGTGTRSAEI